MALSPVDRDLLRRCLDKEPGSWNDFVDRFLSLIYHCVHYTSYLRSAPVTPEDVEDIAAEVLLQIVADDYKCLRKFRGKASLATYITVIARRTCIHELNRRQAVRSDIRQGVSRLVTEPIDDSEAAAKSVESLEEVERLLRKLSGKEREIVRLYYLQSWTYEEISTEINVPVNNIGTVLYRARKKLRERRQSSAESKTKRPAGKKKGGVKG
ncbi:MAG TPA: sigma-70 family RNA polymerase sigma factor [Fimbriiglobus sp.]